MPAIAHEPWCESHDNGAGLEACSTDVIEFGPLVAFADWSPSPTGGLFATQCESDDSVSIVVDYGSSEGRIDVGALRAIREAVSDDPALLLVVLDELIDKMGDAVPPARRDVVKA